MRDRCRAHDLRKWHALRLRKSPGTHISHMSQLGRYHHFLCELLHWSVLLPTNRCLCPFATPNCNYLPGEASVNKSVYTPWHAAIRFSPGFRMDGQTSSLLHRKLILIQSSCQFLPSLQNFDGSCVYFCLQFLEHDAVVVGFVFPGSDQVVGPPAVAVAILGTILPLATWTQTHFRVEKMPPTLSIPSTSPPLYTIRIFCFFLIGRLCGRFVFLFLSLNHLSLSLLSASIKPYEVHMMSIFPGLS